MVRHRDRSESRGLAAGLGSAVIRLVALERQQSHTCRHFRHRWSRRQPNVNGCLELESLKRRLNVVFWVMANLCDRHSQPMPSPSRSSLRE